MGVDIRLNTVVKAYDGLTIKTDKEAILQAKTVVWTAGVKGNVPLGINKEIVGRGNRIQVDNYSKVMGQENIYALGDLALMSTDNYPKGHPMVAQVAIQQGKLLAKNLMAHLLNKQQQPFKYKDKGSLATVGKRKAVADLSQFQFSGFFAWILWSVVHLMSISGFRNKLLVGINWSWSYFTYDKGNRLIIRKYKK